jgi:hypothetical protein
MAVVEPKPGAEIAGATLLSHLKTERLYSVWKARTAEGPCAVYVVSRNTDEMERSRFAEAAAAMKQVCDAVPGVLAIHEVADAGDAFSCALHDTGTADHLPTLSWAVSRRVDFVRALCSTLGALHERGIVHGCLRPAAILLDAELAPVLADIGIADVTAELGLDEKDTMTFGRYASPEAATGGSLDPRSDVYSLGRVLHFLLVGFPPEAVVEAVPRLDTMAVVPTGLTRIVRKCVSQDPDGRYASMADLSADLGRYKEAASQVGTAHPDESKARDTRPSAVHTPVSMSRPTPSVPRGAPSVRTTEPDETTEADDIAPKTRLGAAVGGGALAVVTLGLAYAGVFTGALHVASLALVAVGFGATTLAIPVDSKSPKLRRAAYGLVIAAIFAIVDPSGQLAAMADAAKIKKGGGASNAAGLKSAIAHGRRDFVEIDLKGADLAGANLSGLSLERADLSDAKLAGADLGWTNLTGANMSGADLTGVDASAMQALPTVTCTAATKPPKGWRCDAGKFAKEKLGVRSPGPRAIGGHSDGVEARQHHVVDRRERDRARRRHRRQPEAGEAVAGQRRVLIDQRSQARAEQLGQPVADGALGIGANEPRRQMRPAGARVDDLVGEDRSQGRGDHGALGGAHRLAEAYRGDRLVEAGHGDEVQRRPQRPAHARVLGDEQRLGRRPSAGASVVMLRELQAQLGVRDLVVDRPRRDPHDGWLGARLEQLARDHRERRADVQLHPRTHRPDGGERSAGLVVERVDGRVALGRQDLTSPSSHQYPTDRRPRPWDQRPSGQPRSAPRPSVPSSRHHSTTRPCRNRPRHRRCPPPPSRPTTHRSPSRRPCHRRETNRSSTPRAPRRRPRSHGKTCWRPCSWAKD